MEQITIKKYKTIDGKVFDDYDEAVKHEYELQKKEKEFDKKNINYKDFVTNALETFDEICHFYTANGKCGECPLRLLCDDAPEKFRGYLVF